MHACSRLHVFQITQVSDRGSRSMWFRSYLFSLICSHSCVFCITHSRPHVFYTKFPGHICCIPMIQVTCSKANAPDQMCSRNLGIRNEQEWIMLRKLLSYGHPRFSIKEGMQGFSCLPHPCIVWRKILVGSPEKRWTFLSHLGPFFSYDPGLQQSRGCSGRWWGLSLASLHHPKNCHWRIILWQGRSWDSWSSIHYPHFKKVLGLEW